MTASFARYLPDFEFSDMSGFHADRHVEEEDRPAALPNINLESVRAEARAEGEAIARAELSRKFEEEHLAIENLHAAELAALRERMPHTPLLLPGYGAQGATAADVVGGFTEGCRGALVNSSRGILFAYRDGGAHHWKDAAREAARQMASDLALALASPA